MRLLNKTHIFTILSILSGAQLTLAFAPFNLAIIAIISPAIILAIWLYSTPKQSFWHGFCFGLGLFGTGASWVYISIHHYGNAAVPLAVIITLALIIVLSTFIAVQGYAFSRIFQRNNLRKLLLAFPATWILFEWLRGWLFTGFPWLYLGYSQIHTPLAHIAPLFGVYGVSFAAALVSAIAVALIAASAQLITTGKTSKARIIVLFTTAAALWLICIPIGKIHWTQPISPAISVSLVQGNIPQELKWQPQQVPNILARYQQLSSKQWNSQIIVWPEAAIPSVQWQVEAYLQQINHEAATHHTNIIAGIPWQNLATNRFYNAMISVGMQHNVYFKRHLVPFGEYTPLAFISNKIARLLHIPMSDFNAGPDHQAPFVLNHMLIAPFICYEIAYADEVVRYFPQAELIVTISDDSWFGHSIAAWQHLQIAQMRSLETGRYQLVSTNTGITAIITPQGLIQQRAPAFKTVVLNGKINPMQGATPWVTSGHYLWLIITLLALGLAL